MNTPISYGFTYAAPTEPTAAPTFGPSAWVAINWPVQDNGQLDTESGVNPSTHTGGGVFIGGASWSPTIDVLDADGYNDRFSVSAVSSQTSYFQINNIWYFTWNVMVRALSSHELYIGGIQSICGAGNYYTIGGSVICGGGDANFARVVKASNSIYTTPDHVENVIVAYPYTNMGTATKYASTTQSWRCSGIIGFYKI